MVIVLGPHAEHPLVLTKLYCPLGGHHDNNIASLDYINVAAMGLIYHRVLHASAFDKFIFLEIMPHGTLTVLEPCNSLKSQAWIPTWHRMDHVPRLLELFPKTTSWR